MRIFHKTLPLTLLLLALSIPLLAQELNNERLPESNSPATQAINPADQATSLNENLHRHWSALADLYAQAGEQELEQMALAYVRELELKLMPIKAAPLSALLHRNFENYFHGWFNKDVAQVLTTTAPMLLLPLYAEGLSKADQGIFFQELFTTYPQLQELRLQDLYDLSSIEVTQFDDSKAMLSIRSVAQAPSSLAEWMYWSNFWNNTHHYFFQRLGVDSWYLLAFDMDELNDNDLFITWGHSQ